MFEIVRRRCLGCWLQNCLLQQPKFLTINQFGTLNSATEIINLNLRLMIVGFYYGLIVKNDPREEAIAA